MSILHIHKWVENQSGVVISNVDERTYEISKGILHTDRAITRVMQHGLTCEKCGDMKFVDEILTVELGSERTDK